MPAERLPPAGAGRAGDLATARSLLVLQRFIYKVGFFVLFSGVAAGLGYGFVRHLAALALASAVVAIVIAQSRQERVWSRHYTSYDEAVWFLLLGFASRTMA